MVDHADSSQLDDNEIQEADLLGHLEVAVTNLQMAHSCHNGADRSLCPWTYFTSEHALELHDEIRRLGYVDDKAPES